MNAITRIKIQKCRKCHRTAKEVRFPDPRSRRCVFCLKADRSSRAARIADRPVRVLVAERVDPGDCKPHRDWIASLPCAVRCPSCRGDVVAHHVRTGGKGGTALKPTDRWCVPLCDHHHKEGHAQIDTRRGWPSFEAKYQIDLCFVATELAARSPHLTAEPQPSED